MLSSNPLVKYISLIEKRGGESHVIVRGVKSGGRTFQAEGTAKCTGFLVGSVGKEWDQRDQDGQTGMSQSASQT